MSFGRLKIFEMSFGFTFKQTNKQTNKQNKTRENENRNILLDHFTDNNKTVVYSRKQKTSSLKAVVEF